MAFEPPTANLIIIIIEMTFTESNKHVRNCVCVPVLAPCNFTLDLKLLYFKIDCEIFQKLFKFTQDFKLAETVAAIILI